MTTYIDVLSRNPNDLGVLVEYARAEALGGRSLSALDLLHSATAERPTEVRPMLARIEIYMSRVPPGFVEAEGELREVMRLQPRDPAARFWRDRIHLARREYELASDRSPAPAERRQK
ncbi:MAG: hypothetical protein HY791_34735 [Deltaproteobacteria bacterium]|nr:hypothetical protein [Deltaproteobacteria bacterium]